MFKNAPVYNATLESEVQILNLDHFERVLPHANVPVDPGAVDTACCEVKFFSGDSVIVLLSFSSMQSQIQALTGELTTLAEPL